MTLAGEARVTLTTLVCHRHDPPARWTPPVLGALAMPGYTVTYDVMAAVGLLRYGCRKQLQEVQLDLARRGIHLCQGELSALSDEFLVRYRLWFEQDRPRWAPWVKRGLVLMIDGTSDAGGPVTYRVLDAKRGLVLYAAHLKSENKADLEACLGAVKELFGVPRVIIRDLSPAAKAACDAVFAGVPQQECHVHFLRDAGEALLRPAYEELKRAVLATKRLARLKDVRVELAKTGHDADPTRRGARLWTRLLLEHVESARDALGGLPFTLAYHEVGARVRDARAQIAQVVQSLSNENRFEPLVVTAKEVLDALGEDARVKAAFLHVDRLRGWFGEIRGLMRLERASLQSSMRPEALTRADQDAVLRRVNDIRGEAAQAGAKGAQAWERVVSRFRDHEPYLWVSVRVKGHERHTNQLEGVHREGRREIRRRTGRQATGPELERVGDHVAVLANLRNPWFVRNVLPGLDLVGAFRAQDPIEVRTGMLALRRRRWRERLPVRAPARAGLLDEFLRLLQGSPDPIKLTAWADRVEGVTATVS